MNLHLYILPSLLGCVFPLPPLDASAFNSTSAVWFLELVLLFWHGSWQVLDGVSSQYLVAPAGCARSPIFLPSGVIAPRRLVLSSLGSFCGIAPDTLCSCWPCLTLPGLLMTTSCMPAVTCWGFIFGRLLMFCFGIGWKTTR